MQTYARKPDWLKTRPAGGKQFPSIRKTLRDRRLFTVCEEARCPNVHECWEGGTATFMILGGVCTRFCRFCAVSTGNPRARMDSDEPAKVAESVASMGLRYAVITSVDRDDLPDGGAGHFAQTVRLVRSRCPEVLVEVLVPDFLGDPSALQTVIDSGPAVLAHNLETVRRLSHRIRDPRCGYDLSLDVLRLARDCGAVYTKSSLMVGLGETDDELFQAMKDLREAGVDVLTVGQYLRPTRRHEPVARYVEPEMFERYREIGMQMGFRFVASGPLVRSSFRAAEVFLLAEGKRQKQEEITGAI